MFSVYIVSGNGFARECANLLMHCEGFGRDFSFGGFIGHRGYGALIEDGGYREFYKCDLSALDIGSNDRFVIGAGAPQIRRLVYDDLKARGAKLFNLIGPHCVIPKSFKMGEGNIFFAPFYGSVDTEIGDCNVLNCDILLGHDVKIGNFNFFGPRSCCLGSVKVGDLNSFGVGSIVLPKAKIGNNNIISPLSCVYRGCQDGRKLHGNPALPI